MLCLISQQNDPYFNLAAEEYFLKNSDEEVFMLYINNPSIITGKHQNLLGEINVEWAREHNIVLARRLSGGGIVYHDHGNLNFSFISNCPNLEEISYKRFTLPIILALKSLDVKAEYSGRNDLLLNDRKISGNAMHIYKKRVLCHGTLLFSTELKNLSSALKNNAGRYIDKSIPSKVVNISKSLVKPLSMKDFTDLIFEETCKNLNSPVLYTLKHDDETEIVRLSNEKYASWNWIFGYSPKYIFRNEISLFGQLVKYEFNVEKGIIKGYNIEDKDQIDKDIYQIFNILLNTNHDYQALKELFTNADEIKKIEGFSIAEFCNQLF